jgi:hypothetical protein
VIAGTAHAGELDPDETITFDRSINFVEADPGERVTVPLVIKNSTRLRPTFTSEPLDMTSGEGSGSTAFQYVPIGTAPRGAGSWIQPVEPRSITIDPLEQAELDVVIDVPADAGAGGHFAALMFTAPDPRPGTQVGAGRAGRCRTAGSLALERWGCDLARSHQQRR